MAFEVGSAIYSHSLALLADAGHMLIDVGAIAGSLVALRLAARPETRSHTYGLKRAEILAAAFNGISLIVVAALVTFEAIVRLLNPSPVDGAVLIVVASVGVAVNLLATVGDVEGQPPVVERGGCLPPHPHRSLRVHRHGDRRHRDRDQWVRARRRHRLAARRRPDAQGVRRAPAARAAHPARSHARRHRPRRGARAPARSCPRWSRCTTCTPGP